MGGVQGTHERVRAAATEARLSVWAAALMLECEHPPPLRFRAVGPHDDDREDHADMPWQSEGDNVSFSGPMADLMGLIMTAYEHDCTDGAEHPTPGEYVTATAVVLREVVIEQFEDEPEAEEFLQAHLRRAA